MITPGMHLGRGEVMGDNTHYIVVHRYSNVVLIPQKDRFCSISQSYLWRIENPHEEVTCPLCNKKMAKRVVEEL